MTDDLLETLQAMHQERRQDLRATRRHNEWRLILILLLFMAAVVVIDYVAAFLPNPPGESVVHITNLRATGPIDVCPGDVLRYSYIVDGDQGGVLDLDTTVWRKSPPQTVIFSVSRRVILIEPVRYERDDAWHIPAVGLDPLTLEQIEWTPGEYERRISLSTPSRNTQPAIVAQPFTIRSDC